MILNRRLRRWGWYRSKVKTLLLQRHAFRNFRVRYSKRAWSDCVLCHFFWVKLKPTSKRNYLHTCRQLVIANWIEIRISSCFCRSQQMRHFSPTISILFTLPSRWPQLCNSCIWSAPINEHVNSQKQSCLKPEWGTRACFLRGAKRISDLSKRKCLTLNVKQTLT